MRSKGDGDKKDDGKKDSDEIKAYKAWLKDKEPKIIDQLDASLYPYYEEIYLFIREEFKEQPKDWRSLIQTRNDKVVNFLAKLSKEKSVHIRSNMRKDDDEVLLINYMDLNILSALEFIKDEKGNNKYEASKMKSEYTKLLQAFLCTQCLYLLESIVGIEEKKKIINRTKNHTNLQKHKC
ncbi:MAG: hypothetical protein AAF335_01120 [Bacteroidota bacterium]